MYCSKCGQPLNESSSICMNCGNGFKTNGRTSKNVGFDSKKKAIIVGLLIVIIVLLSFVAYGLTKHEVSQHSRTVMIYMVGSNLESDYKIASADLASINPKDINLNETKILLYAGGTEKWHNFISSDENAIYELKKDGFVKIKTYSKKSMGDPNTLLEFLNYGYQNYPSELYDVVFYNHGGAIDGALYDDFTSDHLSLEDFQTALKKSPFHSKNKLNTILFRTCLNGTLEVATVFAPYADYLIASEEITYGIRSVPVLNYLNNIKQNDSGIDYGKKYIGSYKQMIQRISPAPNSMYSIIDLSKMERVNKLFNEFISGIHLDEHYADIVRLRNRLYQYGSTADYYDTVDLYTLITELSRYSVNSSNSLLRTLDEAVVYNWSDDTASHGLSVYFPYKGNQKLQNYFLNIYKDLGFNPSYYHFIDQFSVYSTSKKETAFTKNNILNNQTDLNKREFYLQLTEEQANDYADSIYIVFQKNQDGLYQPIYSSDNPELTKDGILKTNLSNNLMKVYDKTNVTDESFLMLIERNDTRNKNLMTTATLHNFSSDDMNDWKMDASNVYFKIENGIPTISNFVQISDENGASGVILNEEDYEYITFMTSSYKILDENGNYTSNWDNNGVITGFEIELDDLGLKLADLNESDDYYCIFKIRDIYGNVYYSKLLNIK